MKFKKAIMFSLARKSAPVTTRYDIGKVVHALYKSKSYEAEELNNITLSYATKEQLNYYLNDLIDEGILLNQVGYKQDVYRLIGRLESSPESIICTVDPFAFLSHFSAMVYHGLTNRIPSPLYISLPNQKEWQILAQEKMESDIEDLDLYMANKMPVLRYISTQSLSGRSVKSHRIKNHKGAFKLASSQGMRVSTMGRTFLDMLRNPDMCGGITHVLEIFEQHGKRYQQLIIDELDRHGTAIDKVRAGYILDERLQIKNEVVESWVKYAQRGGSRKLDISEEYVPKWSEKWLLSINVWE